MRQLYNWVTGFDVNALSVALVGNHVGAVGRVDSSFIYVDFFPDETSAETSAVLTICTGAMYNLTLASTDPTISAGQWTPLDFGTSLAAWLNPANLPHMWQEGNTVQQITPVTATGQLVGSIQDLGPMAHHWTYSGNNLPTLNSDGGTECHLTFSAAAHSGTGCVLASNNSTGSFAFIHNTGIFSMHFMLRVANNGTELDIVDSASTSGANKGIYFRRNSNNTLFCRVVAGLGVSTFLWSGNSTQTLQTTDGMCLVTVTCDGTTLSMQIANKVADPLTRLNAPLNVTPGNASFAASNDLQIGRAVVTVNLGLSGDLRGMVILNRASTAVDRALLTSWMSNQRMSTRQIFRPSNIGLLQPCLHYHDFTVPALPSGGGMYTDSGRGTHVAADGDQIYSCDHALDATNAWGRALISSNTSFNPVYRPLLSTPGGEWNGGAAGSNTNMNVTGPILGGAWTMLGILQNRDQTNGSHFCIASGAHWPTTGNLYQSNPGTNKPYTTMHLSGATIGSTVLLPQLHPAPMVYEVTRNANNFRDRVSGDNTREYVGVSDINTNVTRWLVTSMGNETIVGWALDGFVSAWFIWPFTMTRAQVDSYILPWIRAKFPSITFYS